MFEINKVYKNKNCFDIVFEVRTIVTERSENSPDPTHILYGFWLNRHYDLMHICDETITIPPQKLKDWTLYRG
jgi:hypothetical protein